MGNLVVTENYKTYSCYSKSKKVGEIKVDNVKQLLVADNKILYAPFKYSHSETENFLCQFSEMVDKKLYILGSVVTNRCNTKVSYKNVDPVNEKIKFSMKTGNGKIYYVENGVCAGECEYLLLSGKFEINSLRIAKELRNQGMCQRMLLAIFDYCKENRIKSVTLFVRDRNLIAMHVYEKMGFEYTKDRPLAAEIEILKLHPELWGDVGYTIYPMKKKIK